MGRPYTGLAAPRPSLPPCGLPAAPLLASGVFWYIRVSVIFPDFSEHFQFWSFSAINRQNKQKLALWDLLICYSNKCHNVHIKHIRIGAKQAWSIKIIDTFATYQA